MAVSNQYKEFAVLLTEGKLSQAKAKITELSGTERTKAQTALSARTKTAKAKEATAGKAKKEFTNIFERIDDLNVKLSKNNAAFANNTKAQSDALNGLIKYSLSVRDLGFDVSAVTLRFNKLSTELATRVRKGFEKTQGQLVDQTLIWSRLGVEIGDSTKLINQFDTTLGMSTREIKTFGRTMTNFAVNTGQSINKVFQDMQSNMHLFHDSLDNAAAQKNAFMFQKRARAMGTSMGDLMGILGKFEDITQAQQTGAQLNAVLTSLGGSFDAAKASAMDYPERMNYIVQSVQKVAPRLRQAAPRVQRAYMRAFSGAGFSATQVRKLINFDADQLAGGGVPAPMGAAQERILAQRMTRFGEATGAMRSVLPGGKDFTMALGGAAGVPMGELAAGGKGLVQSGAQGMINVVSKAVTDSSEVIQEKLTEQLDGSAFKKKLEELGDIVAKAVKDLNTHNAETSRQLSTLIVRRPR